jgi:hypothetical protein
VRDRAHPSRCQASGSKECRTHLGCGRASGSEERLRSRVTLVPVSLPLGAASIEQSSSIVSVGELCSPLDLDDESLPLEVLLHITYEVVSQLDQAEEFRSLSPTNLTSLTFLKIRSCYCSWWSRHKTPLPPSWLRFPRSYSRFMPPQLGASSASLCSGVSTQHSFAPSPHERDGW